MTKPIKITLTDYQRLMNMLELRSPTIGKGSIVQNRLYTLLINGETFARETIGNKTVTMNSRVRLKNLKTEKTAEIVISYPIDALPREGRVSVLSDIGIALFGREERELVSWPVPGGMGQFEIQSITYQPEAAGDFHL